MSRSLKELALRATREREGYIHREGREPTIGELADLLGVDAEQAAEALGASLPPLSLTRAGEEDDGDQIDVPVSPPEESITDHLGPPAGAGGVGSPGSGSHRAAVSQSAYPAGHGGQAGDDPGAGVPAGSG